MGPITLGCIDRASIMHSATMTATNDAAFRMKHGPTPSRAMVRAAMAGPTTRATLMLIVLRVMALLSRSAPTISSTTVWRAGLSTTVTTPRSTASTNTIQTATTSVTVSRPSTRAMTPAAS